MKNQGYTLIEMLVAMSIFSILMVLIMNTFVRGFALQKKIIEMQSVQREEAYLMETVSREIRMATGISTTQQNLSGVSSLTFSNHEGTSNTTVYCLAGESGVCSTSGKFFSINGKIINSAEVEVTNLKFYTSDFTDKQPLVTILLQLKSRKDPTVETRLQTSVATRLYQ